MPCDSERSTEAVPGLQQVLEKQSAENGTARGLSLNRATCIVSDVQASKSECRRIQGDALCTNFENTIRSSRQISSNSEATVH